MDLNVAVHFRSMVAAAVSIPQNRDSSLKTTKDAIAENASSLNSKVASILDAVEVLKDGLSHLNQKEVENNPKIQSSSVVASEGHLESSKKDASKDGGLVSDDGAFYGFESCSIQEMECLTELIDKAYGLKSRRDLFEAKTRDVPQLKLNTSSRFEDGLPNESILDLNCYRFLTTDQVEAIIADTEKSINVPASCNLPMRRASEPVEASQQAQMEAPKKQKKRVTFSSFLHYLNDSLDEQKRMEAQTEAPKKRPKKVTFSSFLQYKNVSYDDWQQFMKSCRSTAATKQ